MEPAECPSQSHSSRPVELPSTVLLRTVYMHSLTRQQSRNQSGATQQQRPANGAPSYCLSHGLLVAFSTMLPLQRVSRTLPILLALHPLSAAMTRVEAWNINQLIELTPQTLECR